MVVNRAPATLESRQLGGYITFLDSDDFIAPEYIERLVSSLEKYDADFAACPYQNVHEADFERKPDYDHGDKEYGTEELAGLYLHRKICLIAPALLVKRDILDTIAFDEDCPYDEDGLFVWALLYNCRKGVYCDIPMYNYRVREGSVMHSQTAEKCHKSILCYIKHCEVFAKKRNDEVTELILPNYKIAAQHVLCKNVSYTEFKREYDRTERKDIKKLITKKDIKLTLFAWLYLTSPRLYYRLCRFK